MILGYLEYARELRRNLKTCETLYKYETPTVSDEEYRQTVVSLLPELVSFNKMAAATHPDEPTRRYHRFNAILLADYQRLLKDSKRVEGP